MKTPTRNAKAAVAVVETMAATGMDMGTAIINPMTSIRRAAVTVVGTAGTTTTATAMTMTTMTTATPVTVVAVMALATAAGTARAAIK